MFSGFIQFLRLVHRRPPTEAAAQSYRRALKGSDTDGSGLSESFLVHSGRFQVVLGRSEACYRQAVRAIRDGVPFAMDDIRAVWPSAGLSAGATVVVALRQPAGWLWTASRMRELVDEENDDECRFGFVYETLPFHVERGEEWFLVRWDRTTDEVQYTVESLSEPRFWFMVPALIWVRRLQHRFKRRSAEAMQRAVATPRAQVA